MNVRTLKMADACAVSGYTRDQMRAVLRDLPPLGVAHGPGRNRVFSRMELLVIAIICTMEQRYGIRRTAIGPILDELIKIIQSVREQVASSTLVIVTSAESVLLKCQTESVKEGLIIPLAPIVRRMDIYLGGHSQETQDSDYAGAVL